MYRLAESQRMCCSIATNFNRATQKPGMTIDELTSLADVESIISDWEALYERCPDATPFHSPDWCVGGSTSGLADYGSWWYAGVVRWPESLRSLFIFIRTGRDLFDNSLPSE